MSGYLDRQEGRRSLPDTAMPYTVRQDLEFFPQEGKQLAWVIRDPLSGSCFRMGNEELFLLEELRKRASPAEIVARFRRRFAGRSLTRGELQQLIQQWIQQKLILTEQSATSVTRHSRGGFGTWNPLVIRFRGWDPQTFLDATIPIVRWCFSTPTLTLAAILIISAFIWAMASFGTLSRELLTLPYSLSPAGWLAIVFALALAKVLHELGHAYTCRFFGGRCSEMGVMLLAFIPCLYCNVTDSWTFPRRSQRMAVSGAGILVDLFLAAISFFLWMSTGPGLFHSLCLMLAVACSLNSLLLNGNPLMRYDGYFLLSDLTEIPNLRSTAIAQAQRLLWRPMFGTTIGGPKLPFSPGLALYGVLSSLYLWFVVGLILFGLYWMLEPANMEIFAILLGMVVVPPMLWSAAIGIRKRGSAEATARDGAPGRRFLVGMLLLILCLGLLWYPFPRRISGTGIVRPENYQLLPLPQAGLLTKTTGEGSSVQLGETILEVSDPELDQRIASLKTKQLSTRARYAAIRKLRTQLEDAAAAQAVTQQQVEAIEQQLQRAAGKKESLQWIARDPGLCMRATVEPNEGMFHFSSPLDPRELGVRIPTESPQAMLGRPASQEILVTIPEDWTSHLALQQHVLVYPPELGGNALSGRIVSLSSKTSGEMQRSYGPEYDALQKDKGAKPDRTKSQLFAVVKLDELSSHPLQFLQTTPVRIKVPPASVVARCRDFFRRTFKELR